MNTLDNVSMLPRELIFAEYGQHRLGGGFSYLVRLSILLVQN
jgi:hypothetical protein